MHLLVTAITYNCAVSCSHSAAPDVSRNCVVYVHDGRCKLKLHYIARRQDEAYYKMIIGIALVKETLSVQPHDSESSYNQNLSSCANKR